MRIINCQVLKLLVLFYFSFYRLFNNSISINDFISKIDTLSNKEFKKLSKGYK